MGPFHKRRKNIILRDSKRRSFITDYCELQFNTATLIIQSFRMIKARGCKQRFKSDLVRNHLVPDIHLQYNYTVVQYNTSHSSSTRDMRHENDNSSTAHQFSCCVHRLKPSRTSPHSPGPQPGTLGTASGADDTVDVRAIARSFADAPLVLLLL